MFVDVVHDGILYMMVKQDGEQLILCVGQAETFGKGNGNLSAKISDLRRGTLPSPMDQTPKPQSSVMLHARGR